MLAHQNDLMEVTPKHFGQKIDPMTTKVPRVLYILSLLFGILGFIPQVRRTFRDSLNAFFPDAGLTSTNLGFILIGLAVVLVVIGVKYEIADEEKRRTDQKKRIRAAYVDWYFDKLIPFLETKYNVKFNESRSNVFAEDGEWVKAENGQMIRVKLGGINYEWTQYEDGAMMQGCPDVVFTFNGEVWLSEAVADREINFTPMVPAAR